MRLASTLVLSVTTTFSIGSSYGQADSTTTHAGLVQDDPSQFLTRIEVFNEFQHREGVGDVNISTFRSVIALGKRFTTRFDIPVISNSAAPDGYRSIGFSDISVRLLGYRILESRRAAMLASVEFSFNTAQSPYLGSGKNVLSPVVAFSWKIPNRRALVAAVVQQYYSLWGDETRADISSTRLQVIWLKAWTKRVWTVVRPEFYLDHLQGRDGMNLEAYAYYRTSGRFAVWIKGGAGLFGDHPARYTWTAETGLRYLMLRKDTLLK